MSGLFNGRFELHDRLRALPMANIAMSPQASTLVRRVRIAGWRLYQDFLMPSRLDIYRALLETAAAQGYRMISVEQWAEVLARDSAGIGEKYFILRHDVDTDPSQTLLSSQIERVYKAQASYFFRLSTMSPQVVRQVADEGFHVSYHFEELATYAKAHRLGSRAEVEAHMPRIRRQFLDNLSGLRRRFALPMRIVCSHGDWMNRRLGIMNHAILADPAFRMEAGIDYETYDAELMDPMQRYISDQAAPVWWRPMNPTEALRQGISPLGLLTHPRQWRASIGNVPEIATRLIEGVDYRMGARPTSAR